jgi:two-component system, sensor histidine kinase YesM
LQHKKFHTIKTKITLITVSFSLVVAVFLATITFGFFSSNAQRNVIQSTEFNLGLIAGLLGQELIEVNTVTTWCTTSTQIDSWLRDSTGNNVLSLEVYDRMKEEYWNNRSREYVQRLIVTDARLSRFLQTGNNTSDSWPVTRYNLYLLGLGGIDFPLVYDSCENDPYSVGAVSQVISIKRPIHGVNSRDIIGYVYLGVSTGIILDHLKNYYIPQDCALYLTLPGSVYRLENGVFENVSSELFPLSARKADTLSPKTVVGTVRFRDEKPSLMVTCPMGFDGVFLSQTLSNRKIPGERLLFLRILALIGFAVMFFGVSIWFILRGLITKPVLKIRKKVDAIAESDFSKDPGIEWDNELGDVGRGINDMSGKILSLMDSRLADEKKKRDLEYRMLQSQINPHFLYNTLNSIKWMATIQNAAGIAEMTTALSRLMKNVIKGSRTIVPLCEEISLLDDYFLIQQYRYGGAIVFEKNIPEELSFLSIPCFALQPLMENAIFHGIEPKGGVGRILLSAARRDDGNVDITLEDDGVGMEASRIRSVLEGEASKEPSGLFSEIGLASVDKRLRHSYGEPCGLRIESAIGEYTRAILLVPFLTINAPSRGGIS